MSLSRIGKQYNNYFAYAIRFLSSCSLSLPIWALFFTGYIGLSLSEATIVYTIGMITSMVFEVPSGTRADRFGRKRILGIGVFLQALVWGGYLIADTFWTFVGIELIAGFAGALISGCLISLMYDWYKEQGKEQLFQGYSRRHQIILFVARAIAALIGSRVFSISPLMPFALSCVIWIVVLFFVYCLYDPPGYIKVASKYDTRFYIRDGWYHLTHDKQVRRFVLYYLAVGGVSEMIWAIYQPFLAGRGVGIVSIGLLYAIGSILSGVGSAMTKWMYNHQTLKQIFYYKVRIQIIAAMSIAILPGVWKMVPLGFIQLAFGRFWPIAHDLVNHTIPSSHRATVNSLLGLMSSLRRWIFGGISGWIFTVFGPGGVILIVLCWSVIFGVLYRRTNENKEQGNAKNYG